MTEKESSATEEALTPSTAPTENEAPEGTSVAISRTTTEIVYQKRITAVVVPIDAPHEALALEDMKGRAMLHTLVNERNFWAERAAERDEAIGILNERVTKLTEKNGDLKSKLSLSENNLEHASGSNWVEGVLIGLGGILAGVSWQASPFACGFGLVLIVAGVIHAAQRKRSFSGKKDRS